MCVQPAVSNGICPLIVGFDALDQFTVRGFRVSLVQPVKRPASSNLGELFSDVSGPALCTEGQLVHHGAALLISC